jgi:Cu/Ag efflux protein CusF
MRGFFAALLILFVVALGLGLYFDWFNVSWNRNDEGKRNGVSVNVNRGKIAHDTERASEAVKNMGRKIAPAAHSTTTHTIKGTVTSVDMNDRRVTLTTADNQTLTVVLPNNARISRNNVSANVENLAMGDRVEVVYRDEDGKHVADSVTVVPGV